MRDINLQIGQYHTIHKNGAIIYWRLLNKRTDSFEQRIFPAFYFDLIIPIKGSIHVEKSWLSKPFISPVLKENKDVIFKPGTILEGFRFNPLYFYLLTGIKPTKLIQSFNILENLVPKKQGEILIAKLRSFRDSFDTSNDKANESSWVENSIQGHRVSLEKLRHAVYLLLSENLSTKECANRLEVSTRWIQILFRNYFNLTPRDLVQISRFNIALQSMMTQSFTSLTDVSYSSDFYDQSHFIKSFKRFSGLLPSQFAKENHDFYRIMNY